MSDECTHIGFPPPLLGEEPVRLPILWQNENLFAVSKPPSVLIDAHPWWPDTPTLVAGLTAQAHQGKPELERLGLQQAYSICHMEPDLTGVALIAKHKDAAEESRNRYGSGNIVMHFEILVRNKGVKDNEFDCDLPIAVHQHRPKTCLVSHTSGKKCNTHFKKLEKLGKFEIWQASTTFLRIHQLQIHAMENNLLIIGDRYYAKEGPLLLSKIKKGYRKRPGLDEQPLYDGIYAHLTTMDLLDEEGEVAISIDGPRPKKLDVAYDKLKKYTH